MNRGGNDESNPLGVAVMKSEQQGIRSRMKQLLHEHWLMIKGILWFGGGWTISEIELWSAWVTLGIKFITFLIVVVVFFRHLNKYQTEKTEATMRPDDDNEDGSGSDIDPNDG